MRLGVLLGALLILAATASATAMPGSPPRKFTSTYTRIEFVDGNARPAKLQHVSLTCIDGSIDFGTCPSPREQCYNECYEAYEVNILLCLSGLEGILPLQRALCYGKASTKHGSCRAQCKADHPF